MKKIERDKPRMVPAFKLDGEKMMYTPNHEEYRLVNGHIERAVKKIHSGKQRRIERRKEHLSQEEKNG